MWSQSPLLPGYYFPVLILPWRLPLQVSKDTVSIPLFLGMTNNLQSSLIWYLKKKCSIFLWYNIWFGRWVDGSELNIRSDQLGASAASWVWQEQEKLALALLTNPSPCQVKSENSRWVSFCDGICMSEYQWKNKRQKPVNYEKTNECVMLLYFLSFFVSFSVCINLTEIIQVSA